MIFLLRKAAHNNRSNRSLHALDSDRETTAVYRVVTGRLAKLELGLELVLVAHVEEMVACPSAPSKPKHKVPLAGHPIVVLWNGPRSRCCVKEQLFVVREGDVDYRWIFGDFSQLVPNQHTDVKSILGSKVRQRK